jgi:multidrug transporter EmrE-like cation transporter
MISLTVAANLMLKLGAGMSRAERIVLGLLGWKSVAGPALFGCSGLLYALLLRRVPLNVAQTFTSAQFVGVIIAADLILGEPISLARWLGIGSICFGILLVGLTVHA